MTPQPIQDGDRAAAPSGAPPHSTPAWWLVFTRELTELWIGGKALVLLILFCVMVAIASFLQVSLSEQDLIPPPEMVYALVWFTIGFGLLMGIALGSDTLSGERERLTLEALLLAPASRRQIVAGKFLAAASPWFAALIVTTPYLVVLAQGDGVIAPALVWGTLLGTLLALAFIALSMFVSFFCNANKTSLLVSVTLYLVFLLPTELPGGAQTGVMGRLFKRANPMESVSHFLEKMLVNNRSVAEFWPWLFSPLAFSVLVFGLLFLYVGPGLRLEGGAKGPRARGSGLKGLTARGSGPIALGNSP